jgi:D-serine deaminase-like pyridoxal phosphate-dependent protein
MIPPLSTPALVVDLDVFEANVGAMNELLRGTGKTVLLHVKTHRTPELAKRQLGDLAVGVTCATVGEAEVMVAAGILDVLIANEVVDEAKLARVAELARIAKIVVAADDPAPVEALSRAAMRAGVTVRVLVDVDVLLHRCGVGSVAEALALAHVIDKVPGVRLAGVMGYEGRVPQHRAA